MSAEPDRRSPAADAGPFAGLCDRLARAERLAVEMRAALLRGDADAIDETTARLGTVVVETRLLVEELRRIENDGGNRDWERWQPELRRATTRLARQSAIGGGLLDGLVTLSRRLLDTVATAQGDGYDSAGRSKAPRLAGLRLKETT